MQFDEALRIVNAALQAEVGRALSGAEQALLAGAWEDQTYEEIAATSGYSVNYLQRDIGPKFWKLLAAAFGRKLNKTNVRAILTQLAPRAIETESDKEKQESNPAKAEKQLIAAANPRIDWGEVIDVSIFYGRAEELVTLSQWLSQAQCRLIALLGMGGMGKSSLAAKVAHQLQDQFEYVIWRSLRNAPPLETLLSELVPFLSNQQDTQAKPERFLYWLRKHRCLVILDNVETILQPGDRAGYYQPDYENYGDLLRLVGESVHQSCILLTSREKPAEVSTMEGVDTWVRSLQLTGSWEASLALIESKELVGTVAEKRQLCEVYDCSPLALKIVAASIQNLFDGIIADFLREETLVFNGLRRLLDQQFERLSHLEQTIMYWLAINREWTSIAELIEDIVPNVPRANLLESLESLACRSLIERQSGRYTQQPVVMEYVTGRLIDQIASELATAKLQFFKRFALAKNVVQDYIRDSQVRVILVPILNKLLAAFYHPDALTQQLQRILDLLQRENVPVNCYSAGNLINLLCCQSIDLTGYNFAYLTIYHAHLQKVNLHHVNFAHSKFINPVFTHTLSSIFAVAFSPCGQLLATGGNVGEVHIWRIDEAQPLLVLKGHANRVLSVCFSPDSSLLASASVDCTINLWDVASGRLITTLKGHSNGVCSVSFSEDQTMLASAGMDHTIILWNLKTQQPIRTLKGHDSWVWAVSFSPWPNSKLLASGSADTTIKLWDAESGELLKTLGAMGQRNRIWSVCFSPTAQMLASTSEDSTVKLWDIKTGKLLRTLEGHIGIVWSASFSTNGEMLTSSASDQTVRIWNVQTGELLRTLKGHTNRVWSVCFSPVKVSLPSGMVDIVASGSADCTARLWDAESGRLIKTIQGYTNGVRSLDFSANGSMLASGTAADHAIRLWDVKTGKLLKTLQHHTDSIHSVRCRVTTTGKEILASGSSDYTVKLWYLHTGQLMRTLHGHTDTIWSISLNVEGSICASAGADYTIRLWDVETGQLLKTLQEHEGWVWTVCFSPDGKLLASGSGDSTIKLWDVETGQALKTLQGHTAWVRSVTFSPKGNLLVSGSADCTIKLWDLESGQLRQTLHDHNGWIWEVSFSPDGARLASSSTDHTVKLWDVQSGQLLNTLEGHINEVWSVRFSPEGNILASSGADETVRIWDTNIGRCLKILRPDRPYEGMDISGVTGITEAQKVNLKALGAVESSSA